MTSSLGDELSKDHSDGVPIIGRPRADVNLNTKLGCNIVIANVLVRRTAGVRVRVRMKHRGIAQDRTSQAEPSAYGAFVTTPTEQSA